MNRKSFGSRIARVAAFLAITSLGAAGVSACGESGDSGGSGAEGDTITFGLISAFSGPAASFGPNERASVELAVDKINADGGIKVGDKTYKLNLKTYDSAYDPTKAVTVTRQAVNQDGLTFLEVLGGGIVPAVQPITEQAKVLVFATAAGDAFLGPDKPYTFRPYYDIPRSAQADLEYLKDSIKSSPPKVVQMYPDDDLGHGLAPQTAKLAEESGYTASQTYIARELTDFAPVLSKVLDGDPDVIDFGPGIPSQYSVIVKQARQLGYKGTFIFPDTVDLKTIVEAAGKGAAAGAITSPNWESFDTEAGKYWSDNVGSKRGGDASQAWTAQPYDNLFLLKAAIEKAGSLDTTEVAKALKEVSIEGALGTVRYDDKRTFDIPYPLGEITDKGTVETVSKEG